MATTNKKRLVQLLMTIAESSPKSSERLEAVRLVMALNNWNGSNKKQNDVIPDAARLLGFGSNKT